MSLRVHIAQNCGPTGRTIEKLLVENGVTLTHGAADGHVCWGAGGQWGEHVLNARCSQFNKLTQLQVLTKAGVQTVPVVMPADIPQLSMSYPYPKRRIPFVQPLVARKLNHHGGTDIRYCKDTLAARRALQHGRAYFTRYIPSVTEFRVWVYRKRHLGTYEKVLAHPEMKHKFVGRNYRNGFAFTLVTEPNIPRNAVDLAVKSVAALGLDFGAVDVLHGKDGRMYVLEVNTAPGVQGETRQAIQSLAQRIARWEQKGFPPRKEGE